MLHSATTALAGVTPGRCGLVVACGRAPADAQDDLSWSLPSAVALFQLVAVTMAALPPNRYSDAAAPHTTYLSPMFTQNWRLFAPNPIAEDRTILFQGSYQTPTGPRSRRNGSTGPTVELDLVHHRLIGGRAGYVTNKLFSPLGARYGADFLMRSVAWRRHD